MMRQPFTTEPAWEERMAAAWEAGRDARRNGLPLDRCPHRPGTPAEAEWTAGWHDAATAATAA